MAEKRITNNEKFEMIKRILKENEDVDNRDMLLEFVEKEQEKLTKARGKTKTQKENEVIMEVIYKALEDAGKMVSMKELMDNEEVANYKTEEGKNLTSQKISALIKKLIDDEKVIKDEDKKKRVIYGIVGTIVEDAE